MRIQQISLTITKLTVTICLLLNFVFFAGQPAAAQTTSEVDPNATALIISGGSQFTDSAGRLWSADRDYTGGNTFASAHAIAGTSDPQLYQTERWGDFSYSIPVVAAGVYEVKLHFAEIYFNQAGMRQFDVKAEGDTRISNLDIWSEAGGANIALTKTLEVDVSDGILNLNFIPKIENPKISAIEISLNAHPNRDHELHVVTKVPAYAVDYEGNGSEVVTLDGEGSHTHGEGRKLKGFSWKNGATVIGTTANAFTTLSLGQHSISLTIIDDIEAALTALTVLHIYPSHAVGGVLTAYYPNADITTLQEVPSFQEILPALRIEETGGKIGGSSISGDVAIVMTGNLELTTAATYRFTVAGSHSSLLSLDGTLITPETPVALSAGTHTLEARIARQTADVNPVEILASIQGAPLAPLAVSLTHDESTLKPFINDLSQKTGSTLGGQPITLKGIAFFEGDAAKEVKVHWGNKVLSGADIHVKQGEITFDSPPGALGTILVSVETPHGISNPFLFEYLGEAVPITFAPAIEIANIERPTQAEWGPDNRLYVGTYSGKIFIYTFDDDYNVVDAKTQVVSSVSTLANNNILGIAFNPFESTGSPKIYIAHNHLFAGKDMQPGEPFLYNGQVSVLEGPDFSIVKPLITGLPVPNSDHGVNGLAFDNHGDLLIAVGSATNAGVPHHKLGGLPESPLGAAVLKAKLSKPDFQGTIKYLDATGAENIDQLFGDKVDLAPGVDVSVFAAGLRNPFDVVWTTSNKAYATVNGPNHDYGAASTSATTDGPDPETPDELNLLESGNYYGHPNRNRGRHDPRQNVYHGPAEATIPNIYTAPLKGDLVSSTNGLVEYRSNTFGGQLKGHLLAQNWKQGHLYNIELSADGTAVQSTTTIKNATAGLDVIAGPGGAIITTDFEHSKLKLLQPSEDQTVSAIAYDIFPWRAPIQPGSKFIVGGKNFGNLANTTVTIGGKQATLTRVSANRIEGIIPLQASVPDDMVDVLVSSAGETSTLAKAFRYLTHR